jgi:SAM-dependent methyltransferase
MSRTPPVAASHAAAPALRAPDGPLQPAAAAHAVRDAFDRIARSYDEDFTDSLIGRLQREAVWRHLGGLYRSGDCILDLGCGTGADALELARRGMQVEAVDVSEQMIAEARRKIAAAGMAARISTRVLAIEGLTWNRQSCLSTQTPDTPSQAAAEDRDNAPEATNQQDRQEYLSHPAPFDGAISNFGALNCVQHLQPVSRALAGLIRPGGYLALGLISPFCLWETAYYALQGRLSKAARRWSNGGRAFASFNGSAGLTVHYHRVREMVETFQPQFRLERHSGIGILVPPTYLEQQARRVPKLTKLASTIDESLQACPLLRAAADHTLLVFRRERVP